MAIINIEDIKDELITFFRNQDIFSISTRGVSTTTDTFSGDASETEFTITPTSGVMRNVREIQLSSVVQSYGADYVIDYKNSKVVFITPPPSGTDNISIEYDYGTSDKIFTDYPRDDLSIESYPRLTVDVISTSTEPGGMDNVYVTNVLVSLTLYESNIRTISEHMTSIRTKLINNRNNFYYLGVLHPTGTSGILTDPNRKDRIIHQSIDFTSEFNYEIN